MEETYDHLVKVLMIGESGVGKTCLIQRFFNSEFHLQHLSTIAIDFKLKTLNVGDSRVKMQIWDTAGQERFKGMTTSFFRGSDGIVLCYSIDDIASFEKVTEWMNDIKIHAPTDVSVILVGNKCDIEDNRKVSFEQGEEIAKSYGINFYESSAKSGKNVKNIFENIATKIVGKVNNNLNSKSGELLDNKSKNKLANCC